MADIDMTAEAEGKVAGVGELEEFASALYTLFTMFNSSEDLFGKFIGGINLLGKTKIDLTEIKAATVALKEYGDAASRTVEGQQKFAESTLGKVIQSTATGIDQKKHMSADEAAQILKLAAESIPKSKKVVVETSDGTSIEKDSKEININTVRKMPPFDKALNFVNAKKTLEVAEKNKKDIAESISKDTNARGIIGFDVNEFQNNIKAFSKTLNELTQSITNPDKDIPALTKNKLREAESFISPVKSNARSFNSGFGRINFDKLTELSSVTSPENLRDYVSNLTGPEITGFKDIIRELKDMASTARNQLPKNLNDVKAKLKENVSSFSDNQKKPIEELEKNIDIISADEIPGFINSISELERSLTAIISPLDKVNEEVRDANREVKKAESLYKESRKNAALPFSQNDVNMFRDKVREQGPKIGAAATSEILETLGKVGQETAASFKNAQEMLEAKIASERANLSEITASGRNFRLEHLAGELGLRYPVPNTLSEYRERMLEAKEAKTKYDDEIKVKTLIIRARNADVVDEHGHGVEAKKNMTKQEMDNLLAQTRAKESVNRVSGTTAGNVIYDKISDFTERHSGGFFGTILKTLGADKRWGHIGGETVRDSLGNPVYSRGSSGPLLAGGVNGGLIALATFSAALKKAASAAIDFGKAALAAYGEVESVRTNLNVVYGSKSQSDDMFSQISEYATKSPFGVKQVSEFAVLLKQSGIYNSDLMDTLKMIGDVAGGNSEKYARIANNLAQIAAAGKATAMDMRQFANAGIPVYKELAKIDGFKNKSSADLRKMTSEGKVTDEVIMQVFRNLTGTKGAFNNAVETGAKTFKAKVQNLEDIKQLNLSEWGEFLFNSWSGHKQTNNENSTGPKLLSVTESILEYVGDIAKQHNNTRNENFGRNSIGVNNSFDMTLRELENKFFKLSGNSIYSNNPFIGESRMDEKLRTELHAIYDSYQKTLSDREAFVQAQGGTDAIMSNSVTGFKEDLESIQKAMDIIKNANESIVPILEGLGPHKYSANIYENRLLPNGKPTEDTKEKLDALRNNQSFNDLAELKNLFKDNHDLFKEYLSRKEYENIADLLFGSGQTTDLKETLRSINFALNLLYRRMSDSREGKILETVNITKELSSFAENTEQEQNKDTSTNSINTKIIALAENSADYKKQQQEKEEQEVIRLAKEALAQSQKYGIKEDNGLEWARMTDSIDELITVFDKFSKANEIKIMDLYREGKESDVAEIIRNFQAVLPLLRKELASSSSENASQVELDLNDVIRFFGDFQSAEMGQKRNILRNNLDPSLGRLMENAGSISPEFLKVLKMSLSKIENVLPDPDAIKAAQNKDEDNRKEYRPFWERLSSNTLGLDGQLIRGLAEKGGSVGTEVGKLYEAMTRRKENESLAKQLLKDNRFKKDFPKTFANEFIKYTGEKTSRRADNRSDSVNQKELNRSLRQVALSATSSKDMTDTLVSSLSAQIEQIENFFAAAPSRAEEAQYIMDFMNPSKKDEKSTKPWDALGYTKNDVESLKSAINAFGLGVDKFGKFTENLPEALNKILANAKDLQMAASRLSVMKDITTALGSDRSKLRDQRTESEARSRGRYMAAPERTENGETVRNEHAEDFNSLRFSIQEDLVNKLISSVNSNPTLKSYYDSLSDGNGMTKQMAADFYGQFGTDLKDFEKNAESLFKQYGGDKKGVKKSETPEERLIASQSKNTDALDRNTDALLNSVMSLSGAVSPAESEIYRKMADSLKSGDYKTARDLYADKNTSAKNAVPAMLAAGVTYDAIAGSGVFTSDKAKAEVENHYNLKEIISEMGDSLKNGDTKKAFSIYSAHPDTNAGSVVRPLLDMGVQSDTLRKFADNFSSTKWQDIFIAELVSVENLMEKEVKESENTTKAVKLNTLETARGNRQEAGRKKSDTDAAWGARQNQAEKMLAPFMGESGLNSQLEKLLVRDGDKLSYNDNNPKALAAQIFDPGSAWINLLGNGNGLDRVNYNGESIPYGFHTDDAGNTVRNTAQQDRALDWLRNKSGDERFKNLEGWDDFKESVKTLFEGEVAEGATSEEAAKNVLLNLGMEASDEKVLELLNSDGTLDYEAVLDVKVKNVEQVAAVDDAIGKFKESLDNIKNTVKNNVTAELSNTLFTMGKLYNEGENYDDILTAIGENWKAMAANIMKSLGPQLTQTGLAMAAEGATSHNWGLMAGGLALAASGGVMSFVGGVLSGEEQEEESDKDNGETEKIQNLKDALSDLIDQAKTDAEYYQKNYLHRNALTANEGVSSRSVNDAIITPNGSVVTTHPDDYLIATKTPGALIGAGNADRGGPNISFTVVNASGQPLEISDTESNEDEEGNMDIRATVIAVVGDAMARGDLDDAYNAMTARKEGYSVNA